MTARLVLIAVVLAVSSARAGTVTVVATGDAELQATLSMQVESWLRSHGHAIAPALTVEATSTLLNCMTMDDQGCARGVVEAQARGESVLYAQAIKSRASNATVLNVYWFPKGKEPIGMRRACEECSPDLMRSTLEEMLAMILGASKLERGRIALHSKPEGMTVLLDNENIGVTPLEREVAAGEHTIVLMHRGQQVGKRTLNIHAEVTAEITIPVTLPAEASPREPAPSRLVPGLLLGVGGVALATGIVLYATSETDDGTQPTYRDTRPLGLGVAAGGVALAAVGAWLWVRAGNNPDDSAPIASFDSRGGIIGWSRAF